jgi:hypothetical protein
MSKKEKFGEDKHGVESTVLYSLLKGLIFFFFIYYLENKVEKNNHISKGKNS